MAFFKRDNKSNERRGGKGFGGRDSGGRGFGNGERRQTLNKAVCSDCKKGCEVPFKPTGDRPVYCSDCFRNHDNDGGSARPTGSNFRKPNFDGRREQSSRDRPMFEATCANCKKRCEVPFKPTGDKPVYCSDCFEKSGGSMGKGSEKATNQYKEQFDILNSKLDRIINILALVNRGKEEKKEAMVEEKEKSKKVPDKK
ncbi:MAG: CxxC-x17-CxxC domain-containing protein, partial [Candidatus Gracilibacteria bacterium]